MEEGWNGSKAQVSLSPKPARGTLHQSTELLFLVWVSDEWNILHDSRTDRSQNIIFELVKLGSGYHARAFFLQTKSRTVICVDYAMGKHESSRIFFGLNEAF
jgi:hypothetical protein